MRRKKSMSKVTIIGAGLSGSLLAIYLARRGFAVDVFEARGDMRKEQMSAGRSINMALSDRGIAALREVGMDEYMLREAIPMHGRMIHDAAGKTKLLPYSGRSGEFINSISRGGLNIALMNEAEKYDGVNFHFNMRCDDVDLDSGEVKFKGPASSVSHTAYDTVIATDGAGSAVRRAMENQLPEFQISSVFLEHGYKELVIPPVSELNIAAPDETGDPNFAIEKYALHIWPRRQFMMIALPNLDGSFTCTLFIAHKDGNANGSDGVNNVERGERNAESKNPLPAGRVSATEPAFDQLTDEASVNDFFKREFPDALELMPSLAEDFFSNPTGLLGTVKCWPWNFGGKILLLGDAAHAVVPFYGQGFNCAFEDVRVLAGLIDKQLSEPPAPVGDRIDWGEVFTEYGRLRKPNTDAIADMAVENFYEMRDRVADPVFQRKRELETRLEQTFPDYFSKYSMVTFREDMPYSEAKQRGNAQDELLMQICRNDQPSALIDLDQTMEKIRGL